MWILVLRRDHESLSRKIRDCGFGHLVHIRRDVVAVVDAAELNGALCRLSKTHACATALAEDTLVGHFIILRRAAVRLRGNLFELLLAFFGDCIGRARHGMRCLAATRCARVGKVLARIAPHNVANLPRHAQHFRAGAMHIDHRLRAQVADARLKLHAALRRDHQQSVEARSAANVATK